MKEHVKGARVSVSLQEPLLAGGLCCEAAGSNRGAEITTKGRKEGRFCPCSVIPGLAATKLQVLS